MNPNDPNVLLLETVARHLDNDLLREVVFIGGAVAGLLMISGGMPRCRASCHTCVLYRSPIGLSGGESSACHVK